MWFAKFSKAEKRFFLFIGAPILFLAIVDRLIVAPVYNSFIQINKNIEKNEKQLSLYLRSIKQKDSVSREFQKYVENLKKTGSDEEEVTKLLREIETLASKAGVSLSSTKSLPVKKEDFYTGYSVEIEAEGTMEALTNFLYQLNTSNHLLRAERLRFNLKDKDSPAVKASLLISKIVFEAS